jgi:hypothetical protein
MTFGASDAPVAKISCMHKLTISLVATLLLAAVLSDYSGYWRLQALERPRTSTQSTAGVVTNPGKTPDSTDGGTAWNNMGKYENNYGNYLIGFDWSFGDIGQALGGNPMIFGCGNINCTSPIDFALLQMNDQSQAVAAANGSLNAQYHSTMHKVVDPLR